MNVHAVQQTIDELRSAVTLSAQFGTPVADAKLLLDWANQLEQAIREVHAVGARSDERTTLTATEIERYAAALRVDVAKERLAEQLAAWNRGQ